MIISTGQISEGNVLTVPGNINSFQDEWKGDGIAGPLAAAWDELMAKYFVPIRVDNDLNLGKERIQMQMLPALSSLML